MRQGTGPEEREKRDGWDNYKRDAAPKSCKSCLLPLLHVLLIATANNDRLSSLQFYNSTRLNLSHAETRRTQRDPLSTILQLYTANYRAGGRGLPPLPLEATHGHTFYIFYILYTVNYPVRGARDCAPYHWTVHGPLSPFSTQKWLFPIYP